MNNDYATLVAAARRDTTLIPNHRDRLLPCIKRAIAERRGMISTLKASRADFRDMIAEFEADLRVLLGYERFYETAKVKPGARPRISPNYRAYAKAHGRTPARQKAHDRKRWPGGLMCGFILWTSQMRRLFRQKCPDAFINADAIGDLDRWVRFLQTDGVPLNPA